jgi:hypothetical protein
MSGSRLRRAKRGGRKPGKRVLLEVLSLLALLVQKYKYCKERGEEAGEEGVAGGAQFTSFTGTKVQILTQLQRCQARAARGAALEAM